MTEKEFICPFCGMTFPKVNVAGEMHTHKPFQYNHMASIVSTINYYRCPHCSNCSIIATIEDCDSEIEKLVYPASRYIDVPDYIPYAIRQDYIEACNIVEFSPKAAATLCRRCLQGMIRDFWGICKNTLYEEISALNGKIPADQWRVIDALRRLGNIGAHMEKDVNLIIDIDSNEAYQLIQLIKRLFESWYVDRHEEELLYQSIMVMDKNTQEKRRQQDH